MILQWCCNNHRWAEKCYISICTHERIHSSVPHQQLVVLDDTEEFGPLAEALLAQQECADPSVLHQVHGGLFRGPLVTHLLALPILLFLIVRLIGAAHGVRVIVWGEGGDVNMNIWNSKNKNKQKKPWLFTLAAKGHMSDSNPGPPWHMLYRLSCWGATIYSPLPLHVLYVVQHVTEQ